MRSLQIGATGMLAQQTNVDTIANNIANMNKDVKKYIDSINKMAGI